VLTQEGSAVCEAVQSHSAKVAAHLTAKLTRAQARALHGALDRLLKDEAAGRLSGL